MRARSIVLIAIAVVAAVAIALVLTGRAPWASQKLQAVASAWTAPSTSAAAGTDAPLDAGTDAAVKVQAGPLSSAQLSGPLYHVTFLAECGAPPDMKVVIKATVKMGRAIDVLATTDPANPVIAGCIERATRNLKWDASRKTDKVTVRY